MPILRNINKGPYCTTVNAMVYTSGNPLLLEAIVWDFHPLAAGFHWHHLIQNTTENADCHPQALPDPPHPTFLHAEGEVHAAELPWPSLSDSYRLPKAWCKSQWKVSHWVNDLDFCLLRSDVSESVLSVFSGHPSFLCWPNERLVWQRPLQVGPGTNQYCQELDW